MTNGLIVMAALTGAMFYVMGAFFIASRVQDALWRHGWDRLDVAIPSAVSIFLVLILPLSIVIGVST